MHFSSKKKNVNWTFLIFFVLTIVFPLELEIDCIICLLLLRLMLHMHRWDGDVAGHKLWNSIIFLILKTSLPIPPISKRHYDALRTKIDMWLKPNLALHTNICAKSLKYQHCWYTKTRRWITVILTHFSPMSYFYTPWKRQKTIAFRGYRNMTLD